MKIERPKRPTSIEIGAEQLVRGIFDSTSDEAALLELAALNKVELHANGIVWNGFLWLMMNWMKGVDGRAIYSGAELGAMKERLPVIFH